MEFLSVTFSPDGLLVAAGGRSSSSDESSTVAIWRVFDGKLLGRLNPGGILADPLSGEVLTRPGEVHTLAFSPCGQYLGVADNRNGSSLWNAETRTLLATFPCSRVVAFSPDSRLIAVCEGSDFEGSDRLRLLGVRRAIRLRENLATPASKED